MKLIKEIVIENPPTKYISRLKVPRMMKDGTMKTQNVHYLTANLFYSQNLNYNVQRKIITMCKNMLFIHMQGIPKLIKARIHVIYQHPTDSFDLDNKAYFWRKLFLDVLKTPTPAQIKRAHLKGRKIITVNCLPEDSVKYVDESMEKYIKGSPKLTFIIYGVEMPEQKKLLN